MCPRWPHFETWFVYGQEGKKVKMEEGGKGREEGEKKGREGHIAHR